ncbi:hypothetical protein WN943_025757 [Citrus x changshan-huyou]
MAEMIQIYPLQGLKHDTAMVFQQKIRLKTEGTKKEDLIPTVWIQCDEFLMISKLKRAEEGDRPFNLGNLTMDWERRKWDLMVGIVGGKLQKKDDVFKVEGPF